MMILHNQTERVLIVGQPGGVPTDATEIRLAVTHIPPGCGAMIPDAFTAALSKVLKGTKVQWLEEGDPEIDTIQLVQGVAVPVERTPAAPPTPKASAKAPKAPKDPGQ